HSIASYASVGPVDRPVSFATALGPHRREVIAKHGSPLFCRRVLLEVGGVGRPAGLGAPPPPHPAAPRFPPAPHPPRGSLLPAAPPALPHSEPRHRLRVSGASGVHAPAGWRARTRPSSPRDGRPGQRASSLHARLLRGRRRRRGGSLELGLDMSEPHAH